MMGPKARSHIKQTIERMRRDDTEFITAATVAQFDGCSEIAAATVLLGMGWNRAQVGPIESAQPADRRDILTDGGREFAVIQGRRWTRVAEFLSNGQITARFFVDEATGEVREAEGWKKPRSWRMGGEQKAFVLGLLET